MSRWHEANRPQRIFSRFLLSQRFKLNLMWAALAPPIQDQSHNQTQAEQIGQDVVGETTWSSELFCHPPWQKGRTTAFCLNLTWLSSGVQVSVTHDSTQCGKVVMCCRQMALIRPGYDTAHCVRFCGRLWEQEVEKQNKQIYWSPHPEQTQSFDLQHCTLRNSTPQGSVVLFCWQRS